MTALKVKCQNKVPITGKIQITQQTGAVFFFKSQLFLKGIKGQHHRHLSALEPNCERNFHWLSSDKTLLVVSDINTTHKKRQGI